ncbi:unnamed protein product [Schistosoma mattheei]|uniref:Uncharacterized protein n=1 Tax=Schistosoma mattheei TaxID=31246 RepID=A0A183NVI9_9TREM|nr:unnamed protein product [Schistosoma mattheei]
MEKNIGHLSYAGQSHMMEYLKLCVSQNTRIQRSKCGQLGNSKLVITLRRKDPIFFLGGGKSGESPVVQVLDFSDFRTQTTWCIQFKGLGESFEISVTNSNNNEYITDHAEFTSNTH